MNYWRLQNLLFRLTPVLPLIFFFQYVHWLVPSNPVVPIGGQLFAAYLGMMSSFTTYRKYKRALRSRPRGTEAIDVGINEALLENEKPKYCGYLLYHMCCVRNKALRQMFCTTFIARYYGLSRRGVATLGMYGYASKISYYDEQVKNTLSYSQMKIRYVHMHKNTAIPICSLGSFLDQ